MGEDAAAPMVTGPLTVWFAAGAVMETVGGGAVTAGFRKIPLTTALLPAFRVTEMVTWPLTLQIRYCPPLKLPMVRESSNELVFASRM